MTGIIYQKGDALADTNKKRLLVHVCQNRGGFGAGFAKAVAFKYPSVRTAYRTWYAANAPNQTGAGVSAFRLGNIQAVAVAESLTVVNMLAQNGYKSEANPRPIDYAALAKCLRAVRELAIREERFVVMPKIGTGLAGGSWAIIEALVVENLCGYDIEVVCYEL